MKENEKIVKTENEVQEITENAKQDVQVSQEEKVIYVFPKNKLDDIECKVLNFKGHRCLAMTVLEQGLNGKKYPKYSRSICMSLNTWQKHLPNLTKAVQEAK